MTRLSISEWEDLCDGCGLCCEIGDTGVACPFLDTQTNRCTVYAERFEKAPWCTKVMPQNTLALHKRNVLPASCAYVRTMKGEPELEETPVARLIPYTLADRQLVEKHERIAERLRNERGY